MIKRATLVHKIRTTKDNFAVEQDSLAAFGCCLLYGRVVVALTHSPFPFSILYPIRISFAFGNAHFTIKKRYVRQQKKIITTNESII